MKPGRVNRWASRDGISSRRAGVTCVPSGEVVLASSGLFLFAGSAFRWIAAKGVLPEPAVMEAALCGAGVLGRRGDTVVAAEPLTVDTADGWSWLLTEKTCKRGLAERLHSAA